MKMPLYNLLHRQFSQYVQPVPADVAMKTGMGLPPKREKTDQK